MITTKFILNNYVKGQFIKTGRKSGNSTYFYKNDKQYLVTREGNYVYGNYPDNVVRMYMENDGTNQFHSHEALYENINGNFVFKKYLTYSKQGDCGFEDPRCITWNNQVYLFTNRRNLKNFSLVQMHVGIINDNLDYTNDSIMPSKMVVEKNWQPIENMPGICIYSHNPFTLVNVFNGSFSNIKFKSNIAINGSSQIVKFRENRLGICHIRNKAFEYLHYFVLYDKDMNILKVSSPFSFFGANVEFNNHLEYRDGKFIILISVHDQIIYEFTLTEENIIEILDDKYDNKEKDNEVFTMFYNDAISNGNVFGALGLATFSKNKDILTDAIKRNHNKNYFRSDRQKVLQSMLLMNYRQ